MYKGLPEWVICGMTVDDPQYPDVHIALLASNRLSTIDLEEIFRQPSGSGPFDHEFSLPRIDHFRLTAIMYNCTVVYASTYVEALARLFNTWSPEADRSGNIHQFTTIIVPSLHPSPQPEPDHE